MAQPLDEFINAVRMADSIEQERFLIATEQAHIRAYVRDGDPELRPRVVSKLVFLDMLGENLSWGQMEAITLMTHDRFSFKRVGYIGASVILDENAELSVLVTQTLLRDLQSSDPNIQCLALTFIANCGSVEVTRAVASEVQKLVNSRYPPVMKRAGMAIVRIIKKNPDLTESFKNTVQRLLNQSPHGVIISGMNLVMAMIENEPKLAQIWAQFSIPFTKILKNLSNSRGSREFNYGVFNDPAMLMKALKALSMLRRGSDELDGILQSIISSTETRRNTGRAVLYQAVDTIVAVSSKPALRGLAFNQVGRLLSMRDPNVLYSALSSFARVLKLEQSMINRGSVDSMALQRYKTQIVQCLDHLDPSIRRRALDVISALIDEQNVESLVPEILAYVKLADAEFRTELVAKIYSASQRFAPSPEWNFDTVHQILIDSGNYVSSDILAAFCELISKSPDLQLHACSKLKESLSLYSDNQSLMQVSSFVLGEFAREDNGISASFKSIIKLPQTTVETRLYIITALAKMAVRFGTVQETGVFLTEISMSNNLEIQQRSGEMLRLLAAPNLSSAVLMPIVNTEAVSEVKTANIINTQNNAQEASEDSDVDDLLQLVMDDAAPKPSNAHSLFDLMDDGPRPPASQNTTTSQPASSLVDLLDVSMQPPQKSPTPQNSQPQVLQQPIQEAPKPPGAIEMIRKADFVVYGQVQKNPQSPKQYALRLLFYNTGNSQLTAFTAEYNVQPGWQMQVQPADAKVLNPKGSAPTSQIIYLNNATNAPFNLQVRIKYYFGSQPLNETGVITSLQ